MNKTVKTARLLICGLTLMGLSAASAYASNTVSFSLPYYTVSPGDSFTANLLGSDFTSGPDGAAFSISWDPAVLSYVNTSITNPDWDATFVNADSAASGLIDYVFLAKSTTGTAGFNFALADFTFNVIGAAGASTALAVTVDAYNVGFVSPGAVPIDVTYLNSQVQVAAVPVPAAVWLFGSALLAGINVFGRRKSA